MNQSFISNDDTKSLFNKAAGS